MTKFNKNESVVVWENKVKGSNHFLVYSNGHLILTVVKPDGTTYTSANVPTKLNGRHWQESFQANGSDWTTVKHPNNKRFMAVRIVWSIPGKELLIWKVVHYIDKDGKFILEDHLAIL